MDRISPAALGFEVDKVLIFIKFHEAFHAVSAPLELTADPASVAANVGVFSAYVLAVKILYVDPFLRWNQARASVTTDIQTKAQALEAQAQAKVLAFNKAMEEVRQETQLLRKTLREEAVRSREELVARARAEASSVSQREISSLKAELQEQQALLAKKNLSSLVTQAGQRLGFTFTA